MGWFDGMSQSVEEDLNIELACEVFVLGGGRSGGGWCDGVCVEIRLKCGSVAETK